MTENNNSELDASEKYVKISIAIFRQVTGMVPFDIFIQRAEGKFTKLFNKNSPIDQDMLIRYQTDKNVMALYVNNAEHQTYRYYVEKILESALLDPRKTAPEKLAGAVAEMSNLALSEIFIHTKVNEKVLEWAGKSISGCIKLFAQDPKSLIRIVEALRSHPHMMKHALMTSIFSMLLLKEIGYDSDRTLSIVGVGGLLHDIGMSMMPDDIEYKDNISAEEWKQIKEHPQLGYRMLETMKNIRPEVLTVVLQHHEQPNGMGYPNNLHEPEIYMPTKIVSIADAFSEKIVSREYRKEPLTVIEALAIMRDDVGRFDKTYFAQFEKIFKRSGEA